MPEDEAKTQLETNGGGTSGPPPIRISSGTHPDNLVRCCSCKQSVSEYLPVLPYMAAFVCNECIKNNRQKPIPESEVSNKSLAPWTDNEVATINEYQKSSYFLPFICPEMHTLIAGQDGLFCPHCTSFSLNWTYPWVLNSFWKQL